MRKLLLLTFTLLCVMFAQGQVQATDVKTVKTAIVKHALELGVDPALALSIARMESGFRYDAKSSHGAVGVFQLMPSTAKVMGLNPYYLNDNIRGGLMYYQNLYKMFGSTELALAAYNAGPTYVKRYKAVPPCSKTFVSRIMADYNNLKKYPDEAIVAAHKAAEAKAAALKQQQEAALRQEAELEIPLAEPQSVKVEAAI